MINCFSFYKFSHYLSLEIYFAFSNSSRSLSIPPSPLPTHTKNIYVYIYVCVCVAFVYWLNHVHLFCDPWTVACQAPLSIGFPRQEYWSGSPCPPPGDIPHPGVKLVFLAWQADSLPLSNLGSSWMCVCAVCVFKFDLESSSLCFYNSLYYIILLTFYFSSLSQSL